MIYYKNVYMCLYYKNIMRIKNTIVKRLLQRNDRKN